MAEFANFIATQPILSSVFTVLFIMLIFNILNSRFKKYKEINVNELVAMMNNSKLTLLDVREEKERKGGHINGDIHIPMSQVKTKLKTLDKKQPILVYCRSGSRSAHIAQMLGKAEFNPYNLKGGFVAWSSANMPLSKK